MEMVVCPWCQRVTRKEDPYEVATNLHRGWCPDIIKATLRYNYQKPAELSQDEYLRERAKWFTLP